VDQSDQEESLGPGTPQTTNAYMPKSSAVYKREETVDPAQLDYSQLYFRQGLHITNEPGILETPHHSDHSGWAVNSSITSFDSMSPNLLVILNPELTTKKVPYNAPISTPTPCRSDVAANRLKSTIDRESRQRKNDGLRLKGLEPLALYTGFCIPIIPPMCSRLVPSVSFAFYEDLIDWIFNVSDTIAEAENQ
jgi:hypothetical protein